MNPVKLFSVIMAVFVIGCATARVSYKTGYDFSKVRKIYVEEFKSAPNFGSAGNVVRDSFIREFMKNGYIVTESVSDADAVVEGSIVTFSPDKKYLIMLSKPGEKKIVLHQPIEIGGSNIYSFGSAFGLKEENQIIVSNATVGVSAMMKDAKSNEVVWSNSFTYEGLELSIALDSVTKYLVKSVPK